MRYRRSNCPGACLTPFVALPGFLTLSALCSPPDRPALFHAGNVLGVLPSELSPLEDPYRLSAANALLVFPFRPSHYMTRTFHMKRAETRCTHPDSLGLLLPGAFTRHRRLPPRRASTAGPSPTEVGTESRCFATGSCLSRRSAPATEAADPFPRGLLPPAPGPASGSAGLAPAFPFRLSRTPRAVGLASCPFPRMPKHPGLGTETPSVPAPRPRHAGLARGPKPAACLAHRGSSHRATL
jgi:hypothetical protein